MSDENKGAPSSGEQTIPKARLDELIGERNRLQQEAAFLKGQLSVTQRQMQTPRVERDSPYMEQLKQDNPNEYARQKRQESELKQLRAGFSVMADKADKTEFIQEFGDAAKKRLADVEQVLEGERSRGNFNASRSGIYQWILGQEKLRADAEKPAAPPPPPPTDAPPSDPKLAQTLTGGSAPSLKGTETREERIAALKDLQF